MIMKPKMGAKDAATMGRMFFKGGTETNSATSTGKTGFMKGRPAGGPDIKHMPPKMKGFGAPSKAQNSF